MNMICLSCQKDCDNTNGRSSCCGTALDLETFDREFATPEPPLKFGNGLPLCLHCQNECEDLGGKSSCCNRSLDLAIYEKERVPSYGLKTSQFRGVSRVHGQYLSFIRVRGKNYSLGRYPVESQAARVTDNAAFFLHREKLINKCVLNFPDATHPTKFFYTRRLLQKLVPEKPLEPQQSLAE